MHRVLLFLLCLVSHLAFAETCKEYKPGFISGDKWYRSASEACGALVSSISSANPQNTYTLTSSDPGCFISMNGGTPSDWGLSVRDVDCGPTHCSVQTGESTVVNWTVGYTRSPNIDADPNWSLIGPPNKVPVSGQLCEPSSGCTVSLGAATDAWQSASPTAQGLFRVSLDIDATHLGTSCAPTAEENAGASPDAPMPQCTGYVGEVNGVTRCVGTASAPTSNDVPDSKPKPPEGGNPRAGEKPRSGEGSGTGGAGRTPTSGNGGPAGGPIGAIGGSKPDGTVDKPGEGKEQAACGAPGQPKCSINETGTPDGKGAYDAAKAGLDKAEGDYTAGLDAIKNTADKDTSWGVVPSWIAHAECRPWDLGAFEIMGQSFAIVISICDVMPYVVATTSFLWVVATFFLTIAMVFRVTAAPQG